MSMQIKFDGICPDCENCYWYWENRDDDYMDCDGSTKPCKEYKEKRNVNYGMD